jgi:hypothetical protein
VTRDVVARDARLIVLSALLVLWWIISACNQFRSGAWMWRVRRHVPLGLIPLWTFFAPNPARADPRVVWREEFDGVWEGVRELHFGFGAIGTRWLFNPALILNKSISDLVRALLTLDGDDEGRSLLLSPAYIALLRMVLEQPRRPGCSGIQFAVVRTSRAGKARQTETVFLSEVHSVERGSESAECSLIPS